MNFPSRTKLKKLYFFFIQTNNCMVICHLITWAERKILHSKCTGAVGSIWAINTHYMCPEARERETSIEDPWRPSNVQPTAWGELCTRSQYTVGVVNVMAFTSLAYSSRTNQEGDFSSRSPHEHISFVGCLFLRGTKPTTCQGNLETGDPLFRKLVSQHENLRLVNS